MCWVLDRGSCDQIHVLGTGCWVLSAGCWVLGAGRGSCEQILLWFKAQAV